MSPTREQWLEMWESIKKIESDSQALKTTNILRYRSMLINIDRIKSLIQDVIGQME